MISPKVLIISNNSFSNIYNNGKTLEALFSSFPRENLAQIYFHEASIPDFSFCDNYWKISEIDLVKTLKNGKDTIGNKVAFEESDSIKDNVVSYPYILRFIRKWTGNIFREILWRIFSWESPTLISWIREFRPQIIFLVGSSAAFSSNIALRLSSLFEIPLAIYYTDDYLFSLSNGNLLGKLKYHIVEKLYRKVIGNSVAQFAIGELMAEEYTRYFNKQFMPVMNAVPIMEYEPYKKKEYVEIVYFGGLHLNRWRMISRLSSMLPDNCNMSVYTAMENISDDVMCEFKRKGISYNDVLSGNELKEAMRRADVLLHVESDDEKNRRFTRLAISTKIPEYLISGRPILGFGPPEVASMRILSDNKIGMVVSSDDNDLNITKALICFIKDYQMRNDLGLKGYEYAKKEFNMKSISDRLMQKLLSAIEFE